MYYLLILIVAFIFAGNVWVINLGKSQGWIPFFLSMCSYLLALVLALTYTLYNKKFSTDKKVWVLAGKPSLVLFLSNISLLFATNWSTPEKIGFIIGMNVIFVPVFQFMLYRWKVPKMIFICLFLASIGNFIINYSDAFASFNLGDIFALITSMGYALSIVWITASSKEVSPEMFITIQSVIGSIGYFLIVLFTNSFQNIIDLPFFPLIYLGIISYGLGNVFQFIAQKHISPMLTAIILAMTSVISVFIGFVFFGLKLTIALIVATLFYGSASILGVYSQRTL